jgi:DNA invertase Pin-like site-specific DNA recombinase
MSKYGRRLTDEQRQAIVCLADYHPFMSYRAIARVIGCDHGTVRRWAPKPERDLLSRVIARVMEGDEAA